MTKIFAHRGFVGDNIPQNSIASLKNAYLNNFDGVEFDIWFFNGELILKHDQPIFTELNSLPRFCNYFLYQNKIEYWMDFKNLDESNVDEVLKLLKKDLENIDLDKVYFAPFITDYKIAGKIFEKIRNVFGDKTKVMAVCERLENQDKINNLRKFLSDNWVSHLSILHKLIDKKFMELFADVKIFAWTVNDVKEFERLENIGVGNFASDKLNPPTLR